MAPLVMRLLVIDQIGMDNEPMSSTSPSRRNFLGLVSASVLAAAVPAARAAQQRGGRPNILLIMADDMGFSDLGCYGSEIATPNLDALAAGGMRFTHFYNTARCCPTRASLLTGLYPHQAGVGHMVQDKGIPAYQGYLNDSCVTIAEALRPAGYRALMSGKWHVGEKEPHWPMKRGFERYYGLISGASNYFKLDKGRTFAIEDKAEDPTTDPEFYMTNNFTDAAMKYLDEYAGKADPFFLYLAYTCPHWPLHALPEDIELYRGRYMMGWDKLREQRRERQVALGMMDKSTPLSQRPPGAPAWDSLTLERKQAFDLKMAIYAAQIHRMDRNIGRLVAKLKQTGAYENTVILFLADNGGCAEEVNRGEKDATPGTKESFLSYGLPWANASNTPLRLWKSKVHEGGISSPLIAHWPGRIQPNSITRQPGHVIDLMATSLDLAGAEYPRQFKGRPITPLEGKSLVPVFRGQTRPGHEAIFWEHQGNRAVRSGRWKLVAEHNRPWALYDLESDRIESRDMAGEQPGKVAQLQGVYDAWARRAGVVPWGTFK